jgi:long-chain acyl-CoA synthetase
MHPSIHARNMPDKAALILVESDRTLTYRDLDAASNQGAHLLRRYGVSRGGVIATLFANGEEVFVVGWAAQRAGLYATAISNKLSAEDVAYILADCGASILVVSDALVDLAQAALRRMGAYLKYNMPKPQVFVWSMPVNGWLAWVEEARGLPSMPIADESPGADLLYSSGTTGRPKGVQSELPVGGIDAETPLTKMGASHYGMTQSSIYLSTSPLYHAAPLRWAMTMHRLGGTVVVMPNFDAEETLRLIQAHHITHATFVPTHFVRMLKLPEDVRRQYDLSSLRAVIHAAAPCPVSVKHEMIAWLGPIVFEYYSGTENCGITAIDSTEWLSHPGSVGRAVLGRVRIVGPDGRELPVGWTGDVFFSDGPKFAYLNDPAKTARAYNAMGWSTFGDVGHLDEDGYLYLSDRRDFMIISGGVNIYPQEIENVLVEHPDVLDCAVFGVPCDELGERVLAVVQLVEGVEASPALAENVRLYARQRLGGVKTPKEVLFRTQLPRMPNGKLMKKELAREFRTASPTARVAQA